MGPGGLVGLSCSDIHATSSEFLDAMSRTNVGSKKGQKMAWG